MDTKLLLPVIATRSGMADLILLLVDRDCCAPDRPRGGDREHALRELERRVEASGTLGPRCHFIAFQAIEELEIWLLAGFNRPNWNAIRTECDPKETYFEPFAKERRVYDLPAEGRHELMREAVRRYRRIRVLCPELQQLEERISQLRLPEFLQ